ncbi:MAG: hypothetical protein HY062_10170 [Bacteroidetes bacterium]|nr:hypothetical protein [Bacteroidota bacterium]
MKTTSLNCKAISFSTILLSLLMALSAYRSVAQKNTRSIELNHNITGSGLGENIGLGMGFNNGDNTLFLGVNFQRKNANLSGIQASYRYIIGATENEKLQLYFSCGLIYHNSAFMSQRSIQIEQQCKPEEGHHYESLSFKVIESYSALGLKLNHSKKISTTYSAGFGAYETLNKNYDKRMYRQKCAPALQFQFALVYHLSK